MPHDLLFYLPFAYLYLHYSSWPSILTHIRIHLYFTYSTLAIILPSFRLPILLYIIFVYLYLLLPGPLFYLAVAQLIPSLHPSRP